MAREFLLTAFLVKHQVVELFQIGHYSRTVGLLDTVFYSRRVNWSTRYGSINLLAFRAVLIVATCTYKQKNN